MPIVPTVSALITQNSAVTLPLYAQVIGYDECAFYGINRPDPPAVHSLKPLWKKSERDQVAHFLAEAQFEIEEQAERLLSPRWIIGAPVDDYEDRLVDQGPYTFPYQSRWPEVIAGGVRATDPISSGEAVVHTTDPATVGPVATTVTNENEIIVYHPGTETEIDPSAVTISGGQVTISIPRARLLTEAGESETAGVSYTNTGPAAGLFEQTVDIVRVYNDPSTHADLVWPHCCSTVCSVTGCSEYTRTACIYIRNPKLGILDVLPATYSGGSWGRRVSSTCGCGAERVRLNYLAGPRVLTRRARDAIIRLAHAKMPHSPCNCNPPLWMWEEDQRIPGVLTRERLNCPFGLKQGAWVAWRFANSMKILRGSVL